MANIFEGIFHMVQGLFQSILAVLQAFFNVIYAIVSGIITLVWNVVESLAAFVGASAQFVASNIIILGVLILGYVIYQDRAQRVRGERRENRVGKGPKVQ